MSPDSARSSLAPVLMDRIEDPEPEGETEADEQSAEPLPVVDADGGVRLTRTAAKGG